MPRSSSCTSNRGRSSRRDGLDIGVVTAIAAPASLRVHIEGEGGHAGAVLMPERRDAFLAGRRDRAGRRSGGARDRRDRHRRHRRRVRGVSRRHQQRSQPDDAGAWTCGTSRAAAAMPCWQPFDRRAPTSRRGAAWRSSSRRSTPIAPCQCAPAVITAIAAAAAARGLACRALISRAYHDALFMSRVAPTGMIFIPCRGGVSHRPDEYASPEAIAHGVGVLADTLAALAG